MGKKYPQLEQFLTKHAATLLTPEAEQAAIAPPPTPEVPQQGPIMDSSVPMQAGPALLPAQSPNLGVSPAGQQGSAMPDLQMILQDQQFMMLLQQYNVIFDQNTGNFFDQNNNQYIPPEVILGMYQQYMAQTGAMPPGVPVPGADAGMSPYATEQVQDIGVPPNAQGQPQDVAMTDPVMMPQAGGAAQILPAEALDILPQIIDTVSTLFEEKFTALEKKLSTIIDKLDTVKKDIDNYEYPSTPKELVEDAESSINADLEADLAALSQPQEVPAPVPAPAETLLAARTAAEQPQPKTASALNLYNRITRKQ